MSGNDQVCKEIDSMRKVLLVLAVLVFYGCGGTGNSTTSTAIAPTDSAGNWSGSWVQQINNGPKQSGTLTLTINDTGGITAGHIAIPAASIDSEVTSGILNNASADLYFHYDIYAAGGRVQIENGRMTGQLVINHSPNDQQIGLGSLDLVKQ